MGENKMTIDEKVGIEKIINDLGQLRERKADLEIRKETLAIWKYALASAKDEDIDELFDNTPEITLGMPRAKYKISKPVEQALLTKELKRATVQEWVRKEESIINKMQREIRCLEIALEGLTPEEQYIIKAKYVDKYSWAIIEFNFNHEMRKDVNMYLVEKTLRNKVKEARLKLYYLIHGKERTSTSTKNAETGQK